jgi:hypothetical protein
MRGGFIDLEEEGLQVEAVSFTQGKEEGGGRRRDLEEEGGGKRKQGAGVGRQDARRVYRPRGGGLASRGRVIYSG